MQVDSTKRLVPLWCTVLLLWSTQPVSEALEIANGLRDGIVPITVEETKLSEPTSGSDLRGSSNYFSSRILESSLMRHLEQSSAPSQTEDGGSCELTQSQQRRFYTTSLQTWSITDADLEELDNDVQSIVACAAPNDAIILPSGSTIQPRRSIVISSNLTMSSQTNRDPLRNGTIAEAERKVRFKCPTRGDLLVIRSSSVLVANVVFEDCVGSGTVVSIDTTCDENSTQGIVRFLHVEFRNVVLSNRQRLLDATSSSCPQLMLENVILRGNTCGARGCMFLSLNNVIRDIHVVENQVEDARVMMVGLSVFQLPMGSETVATNVSASANQIRLFNTMNNTFTLRGSYFYGNEIPSVYPYVATSIGGSVLLSNHSRVIIMDSNFENNYGWNGGAIYGLASDFNIRNCSFRKNDADVGNGGAVHAINGSSLVILESHFFRNNANRGAGVFLNRTSSIRVMATSFLRNIGDVGAGLFIENGNTSIESCEFRQNRAHQNGSGLVAFNVNGSILDSSFRGNRAAWAGACIFLNHSTFRIVGVRFIKNHVHVTGGGAMYAMNSSLVMHSTFFHKNKADENLSRDSFYRGDELGCGSAILLRDGVMSLTDVNFTNNTASGSGTLYIFNVYALLRRVLMRGNVVDGPSGGGLWSYRSNTTIRDSLFDGNHGDGGGAIFARTHSRLQVLDTSIQNNSARGPGGGIRCLDSEVTLRRTNITNNIAERGGGCSFVGANSIVEHVLLSLNHAVPYSGGGMYVRLGTLHGESLTFYGNRADNSGYQFYGNIPGTSGGGICGEDVETMSLSNVHFYNNFGRQGGAISIDDTTLNLYGPCVFIGNNATTNGGSIHQEKSNSSISSCEFEDSSSQYGGSLWIGRMSRSFRIGGISQSTISNCTFNASIATSNGGGIHIYNSPLVSIDNSVFSSCKSITGGAIYALIGKINIEKSTFQINNASNGAGGALYFNFCEATIKDTSLLSNRGKNGGGVYATNNSRLNTTNISIHSNVALENGGGIEIEDGSSLLCNRCDFTSNVAMLGGGIAISTNDSMLVVAQFQDSLFMNNSASMFGGGLMFRRPLNISINCNTPDMTCGRVAILNTTFMDNTAIVSGSAILTSDPHGVLVSCSHVEPQYNFIDQDRLGSLDVAHPKRLCISWARNWLATNAPGDVVGTFGRILSFSTHSDSEAQMVGDVDSGFLLQNVASGRQLPMIYVMVLDAYGNGPLPTIPETLRAIMRSPEAFFQGVLTINIHGGSGTVSNIVGFKPPSNYTIKVSPNDIGMHEAEIIVQVRKCRVGEEPTSDNELCQECDPISYNFNSTEIGGCTPCPEGATCASRFIVPEDGYWHRSPCHSNVQECLIEEACAYRERQTELNSYSIGFMDCDFNESMMMNYNRALCREGYEGPLCGSCTKSYGLSMGFKCSKCSHVLGSLMTLIFFTLYLLIISSFTIRGSLPSKPKTSRAPTSSMSTPRQAQCASRHVEEGVNLEMVKMLIEGRVPSQYFRSRQRPSTSTTPPLDQSTNIELTRWITSEVLKVMINFLQVTAVAASINVEWTDGILTMFEANEYVGALSSTALSRPIDCIVSSDSAYVRSIWRTLLNLFIPILVMGTFVVVWGIITTREKKGMPYFWRRVILSVIVVTYITYLGLTRFGVRVFYCVDIYDSNDAFTNSQTRYWAIDTLIRCYEKEHIALMVISIFVLLLVSLSFPLVSAVYLFRNKVQPGQTDGWTYETMGFLYRAFREKYVFWESVVMFRKACLSIIVVFSYPLGGQSQGLLALGVLMFCLYLQQTCSPYRKEFHSLNYFESGSLLVSCFTFMLGQFFTDEKRSDYTKTLVEVIILTLNTTFFTFLFIVFLRSGVNHVREVLKSEGFPIDDKTSWWRLLKFFIKSKKSKAPLSTN